jgi:clan AA aspartic protease
VIRGTVSALREALITLTVRGPAGDEQEVEAVIDTGFDGLLTLPSSVIAALQLPWQGRGRALLGDGSESIYDIHQGSVLWQGEPRRVLVDAVDMTPLLGMGLLEGSELRIEVVEGGQVTITPLAPNAP